MSLEEKKAFFKKKINITRTVERVKLDNPILDIKIFKKNYSYNKIYLTFNIYT